MLNKTTSTFIAIALTLTGSFALDETSSWKWFSVNEMPQNMKSGVYMREAVNMMEPKVHKKVSYSIFADSSGVQCIESEITDVTYPKSIEINLETTLYQNWGGWFQYWGKLVENSLFNFAHPYTITNLDVKNILVLLSDVSFKDIENLEKELKMIKFYKYTFGYSQEDCRRKWGKIPNPNKRIVENLKKENIKSIHLLSPTFNGVQILQYGTGYDCYDYNNLIQAMIDEGIKLKFIKGSYS